MGIKRCAVYSIMLLFVFCVPPGHNISDQSTKKTATDEAIINSMVDKKPNKTDSMNIAPLSLPVSYTIDQWVGKDFIVLSKQQMFINFGYEIYLSKEMENSKSAIDTSMELKNHRIRFDQLNGHTINCKSLDSVQGEYVVTFIDLLSGRELHAKTYKHAIKEIAIKGDLEEAKKRWIGRAVYSKRGIISTISGKNGYSTLKVRIEDSLRVYDVSWGVTPLPVKPIWLMVETKDKLKGFIPVRISWSNVMSDFCVDDLPWTEDIFEEDPVKKYNWSTTIWDLINNHRVVSEMSREQVAISWGKPLKSFQREFNGKLCECWKYQSQVVYFDANLIVAINNE